MTDELPALPTELELDALTLPPEAKPQGGLSRTLERLGTHWHRDRENRIAFVRRNAARDLPAWEQPDDAAVNDLQRRIVEMAGAIPLLVAANFLPARRGRAPEFAAPAPVQAPYAGEMRAPLDDLAQSNRTLRYTIEDLRAEVVRKIERAGQDAGGVAASTCLRELLEAMPNGALLPRHGTDWLSFAVVWPQVIAAWRAERAAELGARWKLHDAAERGETQATDPNALGRLQQAIAEHLAALREACGLPLTEAQLGSMAEVDGMAAVEAAAVAYTRERIDAADAEQVRPLRQDEWKARTGLPGTGLVEYVGRWLDPVHPAKTLAAVLWRVRLRPELEREERAGRFRVPARATRELGQLMGRSHEIAILPASGALRIERVTIRRNEVQADLLTDRVVALRADAGGELTEDDVRHYLARAFDNQTWRMAGYFMRQRQDNGDVWISEAEAADELGYKRESAGRGATPRHSQTTIATVRGLIGGLTSHVVSLTGEARGERMSATDAFAYRMPNAERRMGHRVLSGYRFGTVVDALFCRDAPFILLPQRALKTPAGVEHREWADAFKLYCYLHSYARLNTAGRERARDDKQDLPWALGLDTIAEVANVRAPTMKPGRARDRLVGLLEQLRAQGFLRFRLASAIKGGELVRYSLPDARDDLQRIKTRTEHAAKGRRRRKANRGDGDPEQGGQRSQTGGLPIPNGGVRDP